MKRIECVHGPSRARGCAFCIHFIRRFIFEIYARKVHAARGDEIDTADDDDDVGNDVGDGEDTARNPVSTARIQFHLQFRGPNLHKTAAHGIRGQRRFFCTRSPSSSVIKS